jgi:hypothetical protein
VLPIIALFDLPTLIEVDDPITTLWRRLAELIAERRLRRTDPPERARTTGRGTLEDATPQGAVLIAIAALTRLETLPEDLLERAGGAVLIPLAEDRKGDIAAGAEAAPTRDETGAQAQTLTILRTLAACPLEDPTVAARAEIALAHADVADTIEDVAARIHLPPLTLEGRETGRTGTVGIHCAVSPIRTDAFPLVTAALRV